MQRLHRALLQQRGRRDDPEDRYSLLRAPGAAAETASPRRQSKVRLGHPIKLNFGFKTPRGKRPPCRPPEHTTPFHQSRCAQRMTTQLKTGARIGRLVAKAWPPEGERAKGPVVIFVPFHSASDSSLARVTKRAASWLTEPPVMCSTNCSMESTNADFEATENSERPNGAPERSLSHIIVEPDERGGRAGTSAPVRGPVLIAALIGQQSDELVMARPFHCLEQHIHEVIVSAGPLLGVRPPLMEQVADQQQMPAG